MGEAPAAADQAMVCSTTVGSVQVIRVLEHDLLTRPPTAMLPTVAEDRWVAERGWLAPQFWDAHGSGLLHSYMQSWVLRTDEATIVVDTGVGNDKSRPGMPAFDHLDTPFLDRLATAGIAPEDVDIVVNTHLHADHVGWNTTAMGGEWVPTFPNATYFLPQPDYVFWARDDPTPPRLAAANANVLGDSVEPVIRAGQVRLWAGEHTIGRGLRLELAPGHTPGSSILAVASGTDRALFVGDLLHTPLQVLEPDASSCLCEDPQAAARSRRRVLERAADERALVFPAHFGGGLAVEVTRAGGNFRIRRWAPWA